MILVVAWDGASLEVARPLLEAGELKTLAGLIERGAVRRLASTWPPVTFPAWSSFLTAADPDRHGLTDFTLREGYSVRFANATQRRLPTMFAMLSAVGARVGCYAVPATYPPEPVNGLFVCGFDTPLGGGRLSRRTHPASAAADLVRRYGGLAVDGPQQSKIEAGWHAQALAQMHEQIDLRTRIVGDLLAEGDWDLFMVHFGESDTVAHQFWQYADRHSPRFVEGGPRDAVAAIYRRLDRSLEQLLAVVPADTTVVLVSDHGSGGTSDRVIHWNRWLADRGWLRFERVGLKARAMGAARRAALAGVPVSLQASLFESVPRLAGRVESGCRFGGIDWRHTRVFSEELGYAPALWINRKEREPLGIVASNELEDTIEALRRDLDGFVDPIDAQPVVTAVRRREEVYDGPFADRIPDLLLELREPGGYSYAAASSRAGRETQALRKMSRAEMTGARGTSMAGAHRLHGLCVMAGPGVVAGEYEEGRLADAGATVLALAGLEAEPPADGRPWREQLAARETALDRAPKIPLPTVEHYSDRESDEVRARLRALGYMD